MFALLCVTGCGKKDDSVVETTTTPPAATPSAQPAPATTPTTTAAPDTRLAESQAAINARDYERAAEALIAVQQSRLNEQQAEALANQMRQLQSSLAGAVASGDARAKAAADRLRQSATVR